MSFPIRSLAAAATLALLAGASHAQAIKLAVLQELSGAGATAAMRRRESFMEIDVHAIDAEVAWTNPSHNGVVVGAIAVEVATDIVHSLGDLDNIPLEQSASIWIC